MNMTEAATLTLAEFLLARIADDEAEARKAPAGPWSRDEEGCCVGAGGWDATVAEMAYESAAHIARHDPARVLAECEAKRRIVERARELIPHVVVEDCWYTCTAATEDRDGGECCDDLRRGTGCDCGSDVRVGLLLKLLAAPYADHPDYRQEWRP